MLANRVLRSMLLLAVLCGAGCSSNQGKIVGTWRSDNNSELTFTSDGKMYIQSYSGTYSLGSGNSVTFYLDRPLNGRKPHNEQIVIDGRSMVMTDSDGTQTRFFKLQADKDKGDF